MSYSLRSKIAINLLVIFTLATGILFPLLVSGLQQMLVKEKRDLAVEYLQFLLDLQPAAITAALPLSHTYKGQIAAVLVRRIRHPETYLGPTVVKTDLETLASNSRHMREPVQRMTGQTWAVLWHQPRWLLCARNSGADGDGKATVAAVAIDLMPAYHQLRHLIKLLIPIVSMTLLLFTAAGTVLISRFTLKPIQRLTRRAQSLRPDLDIGLLFDDNEGNEFNKLSSALNMVYANLKEKETRLRQSVNSLAEANQQLKKSQREMVRAEKLSSVGRLASGIAHEIGNPIGIVMGYLELLKQTDLPADEKTDYIQRAENEISRVGKIVRELLDLSRPAESGRQAVSVQAILQDMVAVVTHQPLTANVRVQTDYQARPDVVFVEPDQLRQVFLNLILNAADAIQALDANGDTRGRIHISTAFIQFDPQLKMAAVRISIADDGVGVSAQNLPLIFDPFFSTKQPGKGTGLGLSVSYMLVEKMGGRLEAESEDEKGSCFHVIIPAIGSEPGSPAQESERRKGAESDAGLQAGR